MPINVSQAIDTQTGEKIHILRKVQGSYVDGLWVEGKTKKIKAIISVQVPQKEELELLSGLERVKDVKMFYVNKRVKTVLNYSEEDEDIIVWNDNEYRAMGIADWRSYGYQKVVGAKV